MGQRSTSAMTTFAGVPDRVGVDSWNVMSGR
jgi:hypothetical protein